MTKYPLCQILLDIIALPEVLSTAITQRNAIGHDGPSALPFLPIVEELFSAKALSKHTACAEQACVPNHFNTAVSSCYSVPLMYLCCTFTVNTTCCNGDQYLHELNSLNELISICESNVNVIMLMWL
jgi:hypothetical protein